MYPYQNGVCVVLYAYNPPVPCEAFAADIWACRGCDNQIVTGYSEYPIATHYDGRMGGVMRQAAKHNSLVEVFEKGVR